MRKEGRALRTLLAAEEQGKHGFLPVLKSVVRSMLVPNYAGKRKFKYGNPDRPGRVLPCSESCQSLHRRLVREPRRAALAAERAA